MAESSNAMRAETGMQAKSRRMQEAKVTPNTVKAMPTSAKKKEAAPKAPKAPRVAKPILLATGAEPRPEEFFGENRKGKAVFNIGFDARLTQALKRVNAGMGTEHDHMLANSPVILNHPKVANSKHFQTLLGNEDEDTSEE